VVDRLFAGGEIRCGTGGTGAMAMWGVRSCQGEALPSFSLASGCWAAGSLPGAGATKRTMFRKLRDDLTAAQGAKLLNQ
jgi:hypothetical protein